ncbi:MAG: glycoside hydrolase family 3 protein [Roseburia sp.]
MNQEERKLKRQQDTRKATTVFILFLLIMTLLVAGCVFLLNKFVFQGKPAGGSTENQTGHLAGTEEAGVPVVPAVDPMTQQAAEFVAGMTLEDKIAQMFVITPDALTGVSGVTAAGNTTREAYSAKPVGGLIYMSGNLKDGEQTTTMLQNMQTIAKERTGVPAFLCVDEEGGSIARIAGNSAFAVTDVGDMSQIGATGDKQNAYNAGTVIATYLSEFGFNVDFAPVADVLTNAENTVIGKRSFGSDGQLVADMVTAQLQGMSEHGVYGAVKHFPGHGGTSGDSHEGAVTTERTLEELMEQELVPFQRAVDAGVSFVMAGHISAPNVTGESTPASLSKMLITDVLRGQMGYDGIVITDAMDMGAVMGSYTSDQAAVMAIAAGVDMVLMPEDYETAYKGVLAAVHDGTLTEERINESVIRILKIKLKMVP